MSSPPQYRLGALNGFIPLSDDRPRVSRGQTLSQLIQVRSTTNLGGNDVKNSPKAARRKQSIAATSIDSNANRSDDVEHQPQSPVQQREERDARRNSAAAVLSTPQVRSQRLIGNSNPRYKWEKYYKSDEQLKKMRKPIRGYYERNNYLIQQYMYIDRLLDSSLPHNLIQEYQNAELERSGGFDVPPTISEEPVNEASGLRSPANGTTEPSSGGMDGAVETGPPGSKKLKRTPKALYKVQDENTPLLTTHGDDEEDTQDVMPPYEPEEESGSSSRIVTVAIYINLVANTVLLILKIIVTAMTSSVSILASLVDAALDFLSTAIVWVTTRLISHNDDYKYPAGRRRLEPVGVLVFSIIMITSFVQVAIEGISHLTSADHAIVQLTIPAIAIMATTVVVKFLCWLWCRLIKNSSVQALAQDAMTDVVFNIFSIIFPLVGFYAKIWWLDPAGGIVLSLYVISNWSQTSAGHIQNLTGRAASADERNVLLYLTMRFAKTIKQIQGLTVYRSGDGLICEADLVLDEQMTLRDSHDLGESLQYVLESVPTVDRAFVHLDYTGYNLPSHMRQED